MSTYSINISSQGYQKKIPLTETPKIDESMYSALGAFHLKPAPPQELHQLSDRVSNLTKASELLKSADRHRTRDAILVAVILTAMTILLLATIICFLVNPIFGAALLLATLGFFVFCNVKALSLGQKEMRIAQKSLSFFPIGLLFGPILLSYMLATRVSALRSKIHALEQDTASAAAKSIAYWSQNGPSLAKRIATENRDTEKSLSTMQKLKIRSVQGERDLLEYKDLLGRAATEIGKGIRMASQ